jgi:hypothetical protein
MSSLQDIVVSFACFFMSKHRNLSFSCQTIGLQAGTSAACDGNKELIMYVTLLNC